MDVLHLDLAARGWVVAHRLTWLDPVMWTLSAVGRAGLIWPLLAAMVSWKRHKPRALVQTSLAVILAGAVSDQLLKPAIHRDRPFVAAPAEAVRIIGPTPHDASFPSGHASTAAAGALSLTLVAPKLGVAWWALALAIAYARVYVGVHYPADVLGGIAVGVGAAIAVALVRRWLLDS